jgi:hypothetical protein
VITTGVTGQAWRASVTPWGAIESWEAGDRLDWYVAADDRWHVPADEPSVRQTRVEGTPVVETRVRVPQGDVVHRAWSVADGGGVTIVEITNESTLPIAVAFSHRAVLTQRPIPNVPVAGLDQRGIELPDGAFVLPIGHATSVRVGLPHRAGTAVPGALPAGLPGHAQVVRGWLALTERASRLVLPEPWVGHADEITSVRCELVLGAAIPDAGDDPAGFALALGELVRMGERPDHWLPELVEAVSVLGPRPGWDAGAGLAAAGRVLAAADERRAVRDLDRIVAGRADRARRPAEAPDGVRRVAWVEDAIARGGALLPEGWPPGWLGQSWEAYGVPTVGASTVSLGVRWHGARPAVLWEQAGDPVELHAFGWSSRDPKGETLWPAPPASVAE